MEDSPEVGGRVPKTTCKERPTGCGRVRVLQTVVPVTEKGWEEEEWGIEESTVDVESVVV